MHYTKSLPSYPFYITQHTNVSAIGLGASLSINAVQPQNTDHSGYIITNVKKLIPALM